MLLNVKCWEGSKGKAVHAFFRNYAVVKSTLCCCSKMTRHKVSQAAHRAAQQKSSNATKEASQAEDPSTKNRLLM